MNGLRKEMCVFCSGAGQSKRCVLNVPPTTILAQACIPHSRVRGGNRALTACSCAFLICDEESPARAEKSFVCVHATKSPKSNKKDAFSALSRREFPRVSMRSRGSAHGCRDDHFCTGQFLISLSPLAYLGPARAEVIPKIGSVSDSNNFSQTSHLLLVVCFCIRLPGSG